MWQTMNRRSFCCKFTLANVDKLNCERRKAGLVVFKLQNPEGEPISLSIADIRKPYNLEPHEMSIMTERQTALSLVTCTSCGKPIPPGSESTKFLCPNCGEIQIKRDGKCRKFGRIYKCPKCGFTGP